MCLVPLKRFSIRSLLLHLPHWAAGREEEASRIGWWSSSFPPDVALKCMMSLLLQLAVASTLGPNKGL